VRSRTREEKFYKLYVRGTLLRVLAVGFASSFGPDFWGESSESSCFFTWTEPFGVFMAGTGRGWGERERLCGLSTGPGQGCDGATG